MNKFQEKSELRKWAREVRKKLDLKRVTSEIEDQIKRLDVYKEAKTVMSYLAKDIEISLCNLFQDGSKTWYLPVVEGIRLSTFSLLVVPYIKGSTKLVKGKFNILEPEIVDDNYFDQINKKVKLDLILVPGLCFDKSGNRIGFGGGFYDKFLSLCPDSIKIGCCPKECLVDSFPTDKWDVKVDLVVTG